MSLKTYLVRPLAALASLTGRALACMQVLFRRRAASCTKPLLHPGLKLHPAQLLARDGHQASRPGRGHAGLELPLCRYRGGLQQALGLKDEKHFRNAYLLPALDSGLVEMTRPETPRSSKQRYRRTHLGQRWLETHYDNRAG